jgi:hypothetical protein
LTGDFFAGDRGCGFFGGGGCEEDGNRSLNDISVCASPRIWYRAGLLKSVRVRAGMARAEKRVVEKFLQELLCASEIGRYPHKRLLSKPISNTCSPKWRALRNDERGVD